MEKYCPNCRQINSYEAQFCRFCASSLASAPNFQQTPPVYGNPPWNQPVMGAPVPQNYAPPATGASGRAIAALGLSIGGLLLCCVFTSIPGAILGWLEVSAIKEGRSSPGGLTMAQIGLWLGIIVTILDFIVYGLYLLAALSSGPYSY